MARLAPQIYRLIIMDSITLEVQPRNKDLKAKDLRRDNLIPVEFYGRGVENQSFQVDYQTFRRLYRKAGNNTIISLKSAGEDEINALVHKVDYHPVTDLITHVEFINVRKGEAITTTVELAFEGVAPAVKELGGTFNAHMNEVEIKCLPKDLIHGITVNIESLVDFHTYIRVKGLSVPAGIELLADPEDVVAAVSPPREEEPEEAPAEEAATATSEVDAEKKEEAAE